jgi:uncharacterized protein (TIGR02646 family)
MKRFTRLAPPQYLVENWENWGRRYAENKTNNPQHTFQWAIHEGQKVNQKLLPLLTTQTQAHCSYCDHYPAKISDDTIDHFKPKGTKLFYLLAYLWGNLYYCCADCQRTKWEQFDELLLRPDAEDYSFDRYFQLDTKDFEIKPNPAASPIEQERASITIRIFGLNNSGQPTSRRHSWQRYYNMSEEERDINDFAFRFMF